VKVTFWGAAREVTGSRHLVEANGSRVLLDCGLFQGRRDESEAKNRDFGFDPASLDAVVLSHAHIDHSGALPALHKEGFRGRVHATSATADLCGTMLLDSAHIQEKEAEFLNRRRGRDRRGRGNVVPLYTTEDASALLERFVIRKLDKPFEVAKGISVVFREAGHMLGSATVDVGITEGGTTRRLVFSGDLGRKLLPVLRDPVMVPAADVLIMESTYGNKDHPPIQNVEDELAAVLKPVFDRGGKVIVPAFAVGRTQEVVFAVNNLLRKGVLPRVPIFIDSPLAVEVSEIFNRHPECYDDEIREVLNGPGDPFGFKSLSYVRSVEQSKALNARRGPFMVISASGMAENGRVLHHLRNSIGDPANLVLIVGYQAEHTLGRRLEEKQPVVRIFGEEVERRADVVRMEAFSGHGDRNDLFAFATAFPEKRPGRVFLVHGEPEQQDPFAARLRSEGGYRQVDTPRRGETFDLG
jgi:metallo-beta-lactamase family protein